MISVSIEGLSFIKDLSNVIKYSEGFLAGIETGEQNFLKNVGKETIKSFKEFADSMARTDPKMYHHIYEWYQTGNPDARLFEMKYETNGRGGLSFNSTFSQSKSIRTGSNTPFYDKAKIMEYGVPVVIKPKNSPVLTFEIDGEQIFTTKPIINTHPGGKLVKGAYKGLVDMYFNQYFSQIFLRSSGIYDYLSNPISFKQGFSTSTRTGYSGGKTIGYNWISNAGGVEL